MTGAGRPMNDPRHRRSAEPSDQGATAPGRVLEPLRGPVLEPEDVEMVSGNVDADGSLCHLRSAMCSNQGRTWHSAGARTGGAQAFGNGVVWVKGFSTKDPGRAGAVITSWTLVRCRSADAAFGCGHRGCMLRSVVSAEAANMVLVRCNSDLLISLACSRLSAGNSPDHGIVGTTSLGGPRRPALRQATDEASRAYAAWAVTGGEIRNTVSSRHIRCRVTGDRGRSDEGRSATIRWIVAAPNAKAPGTPIRRARATIARLRPRRRATCAAHVLSHVARPRCIMTVAAWHKARRRVTSPASGRCHPTRPARRTGCARASGRPMARPSSRR